MAALGRELIARGHRVTYFQVVDLADKIASEGLDFQPIGESDHPRGSLPASLRALGQLKGQAALKFTIQAVAKTTTMTCRDLPDALRRAGVDALLVDQMEPAGGAVAEHLGLPFFTICNALAINRDPVAPPPFTPWRYHDTVWARWRNRIGYAIADRQTRPIVEAVAAFRTRWKLAALKSPDDSFSKLAQICQMPKEFDFPRKTLPSCFHYVGPLRRDAPKPVPFPWERLDGRPIVYASLGTLQNSREPVFRVMAESCADLDVQLVLSHGGGLSDAQARALPGGPLVVSYAPQAQLLEQSRLTLTHGLNTVLDSLSAGVPMVLIPITYEQPAIARRVERAGCGITVPFGSLSGHGLRAAIKRVLSESHFTRSAQGIQAGIRAIGGVELAADILTSDPERVALGGAMSAVR